MLINKIEHEGKSWVEFNLTFKIVLGLIFGLTIGLLFATAYLYFTSQQISEDPFIFGAKLYDVNFCSCLTNSKETFKFDKILVTKTSNKETINAPTIKVGDYLGTG